jgi:hypothetical protein
MQANFMPEDQLDPDDGMSLDDFKSMLYQSLKNKGVVDSMKVTTHSSSGFAC